MTSAVSRSVIVVGRVPRGFDEELEHFLEAAGQCDLVGGGERWAAQYLLHEPDPGQYGEEQGGALAGLCAGQQGDQVLLEVPLDAGAQDLGGPRVGHRAHHQ